MKLSGNKVVNYLFIFFTVAVVVVIALLDPNIMGVGEALASIQPIWAVVAVGFMIVYWLLDGQIFHYITGCMHKKLRYGNSLRLSIIGQYYSALTPFGSGEPFQAVYMKREGIPIGYSSSILTVKFIGYQYGVVLLYIAGLILHGGLFYNSLKNVFWLSVLGFAINLAVLLLAAAIMVNSKWVSKAATGTTKFLYRIKIIKNYEKAGEKLSHIVNDFRKSAVFVKQNKLQMFNIVLMTVIHQIFYFGVSYCVYRAFGLTQHTFDEIVTMQVILFVTVSFFPTPGASGANETGFYLFFRPFFPRPVLFVSMMLWRFMTYYLNIIVGAAVVFFDSVAELVKQKKSKAKAEAAEPVSEAVPDSVSDDTRQADDYDETQEDGVDAAQADGDNDDSDAGLLPDAESESGENSAEDEADGGENRDGAKTGAANDDGHQQESGEDGEADEQKRESEPQYEYDDIELPE
ncbi:MAG: flippase-like domain-containing protein [Christensenellales bacterium]|jgi:uncharacterized protein (TIRG00374 family)